MELTKEQEGLLDDFFQNYMYWFRSDDTVDCRKEIVYAPFIGAYPYPDTNPPAEFKQPKYNWSTHSWEEKAGLTVQELSKKSEQLDASIAQAQKANQMVQAQALQKQKTDGQMLQSMMTMLNTLSQQVAKLGDSK